MERSEAFNIVSVSYLLNAEHSEVFNVVRFVKLVTISEC